MKIICSDNTPPPAGDPRNRSHSRMLGRGWWVAPLWVVPPQASHHFLSLAQTDVPGFDSEQRRGSFVLFEYHCQHQDHKYAATNTVIASADNAHPGERAGFSGTLDGATQLYGVTEQIHVGSVFPSRVELCFSRSEEEDSSNVGQRHSMFELESMRVWRKRRSLEHSEGRRHGFSYFKAFSMIVTFGN